MKKIVCCVLSLLILVSCTSALAYQDEHLYQTTKGQFFEYYEDGSNVGVHYMTTANVTYTVRLYTNAANTYFTDVRNMGYSVKVTSNAEKYKVDEGPVYSSSVASGGLSATATYSDGWFTIYYYMSWYTDLDGNREPQGSLNNSTTHFNASKTFTK